MRHLTQFVTQVSGSTAHGGGRPSGGPTQVHPSQRQAMATAIRVQAARLTVPPQRVGIAGTGASPAGVHRWRALLQVCRRCEDGSLMSIFASNLGPLLGRDAEIELLASLLDGIQGGGGALVLYGEPGIGKSRLLAVAAAFACERGFTVLSTTGVQSEAHLA